MNHQPTTIPRRLINDAIRELFEHQALLLSTWANDAKLPDRQCWVLVRLLDSSRRRMNRRLSDTLPNDGRAKRRGSTHPAFQAFLAQVSGQKRPDTFGNHPVSNE